MDDITREKIIKWIFDNHEHHAGTSSAIATISFDTNEMSEFTTLDNDNDCEDGEYPYVNSMALEKFIKEL